ncbi:MAG: hypothetical protein GX640_03095 [Fibrobacter sp.]|nr:hypothetical protein [Fibrobacter sp.]
MAIIAIALFLMLVLIAVGVGLKKDVPVEESEDPVLHASGIYSIVRKSPREAVDRIKPSEEEIRKYLSSQIENIQRGALSQKECEQLIKRWNEAINQSVMTVELGDRSNVEFYFYEFSSGECSVCKEFISRGKFVTREEIFLHPQILPPFHLGCTCSILPHHGKEDLRDTTEMGMLPLFKGKAPPPLPDWKAINFTNVIRGASA